MNSVWEKIANALNSQTIQDWVSGKVTPTIKTDNVVTVNNQTLQTAGMYIVGGFIASAVIISVTIAIVIRSAAKRITTPRGY